MTRASTGADVSLPLIRSNENGAVYKLDSEQWRSSTSHWRLLVRSKRSSARTSLAWGCSRGCSRPAIRGQNEHRSNERSQVTHRPTSGSAAFARPHVLLSAGMTRVGGDTSRSTSLIGSTRVQLPLQLFLGLVKTPPKWLVVVRPSVGSTSPTPHQPTHLLKPVHGTEERSSDESSSLVVYDPTPNNCINTQK